ncbi:MAG TPA: TylF/MycF/NovP-related O-methyltransferase [Methylomirabilota bacterium]|nr:TylF/MycF/NovP-related O-methyltransferase [Methylomirabilota bacterium]
MRRLPATDVALLHGLAAECPETVSAERLRHLAAGLGHVLRLGVPGDVVEVGCYRGVTSQLLRRVIDALDRGRELHVYDSFRGLPRPGRRDGRLVTGDFAASPARLREGFRRRGLRAPRVHAGWFADTLPRHLPPRICFAYLDADLEASTATALRHLYPRLSPSGLLLVDDYCDRSRSPRCWDGLPGVRAAVDRFFRDRPESIEVLAGTGDLALAAIRKR